MSTALWTRGRNNDWRVRITTKITRQELLHYWGLLKRDYTKQEFVILRSAPLQAAIYHAAGFFLNLLDGQLTDTLEREVSNEMGFNIGIHYKPAAIHKRAADGYWKKAKKARSEAPEEDKRRAFFNQVPFAMQVYTETRQQALEAAIHLSKKYGNQQDNRQYLRMLNGTKMRFTAAHTYLNMQGRTTAATLLKQQIAFQHQEVLY